MTNMPTIHKSIFIAASLDTVWSYLTDKEKMGVWYHSPEKDLEMGEEYHCMKVNDEGEQNPLIWGKVLEWDQPNKLVTTFNIAPFEGRETTVSWALEETLGGVMLSLKHEGIVTAAGVEAAAHLFAALDKGWDEHLSSMRSDAAAD